MKVEIIWRAIKMVKFGIEIETIFDEDKFPNLANERVCVPMFYAKGDGSLNEQGEFENGGEVEIVSKIFKSKKGFMRAIKKFIEFYSKNGLYDLDEVFSFNRSCGCHIHISFKDKGNNYFRKITPFSILEKVRDYHFDRINKSGVLKSKDEIIRHYFRNYARKTTEKNIFDFNRYKEFNFVSDGEGTGLEMRGCNLLGVRTWAEFKEMMSILYDTAEQLEILLKEFVEQKTINLNRLKKELAEIQKNKDEVKRIEVAV